MLKRVKNESKIQIYAQVSGFRAYQHKNKGMGVYVGACLYVRDYSVKDLWSDE